MKRPTGSSLRHRSFRGWRFESGQRVGISDEQLTTEHKVSSTAANQKSLIGSTIP